MHATEIVKHPSESNASQLKASHANNQPENPSGSCSALCMSMLSNGFGDRSMQLTAVIWQDPEATADPTGKRLHCLAAPV